MVLTKLGQEVKVARTDQFPPEPEMEFERSQIEIPLLKDGVVVEQLVFAAILRLDRGAPFTNSHGYRQFEFKIVEWELSTYCETFGGTISFTLGKNPQPKSLCLSMQQESDYPAMIVYNAIFDVYLDGFRVLPKQTGLGVGMNVMEVPPRVHVHFQKTLEFGEWIFAGGECLQMASMSMYDLEQKSAEISRSRNVTIKSIFNILSNPQLLGAYFGR